MKKSKMKDGMFALRRYLILLAVGSLAWWFLLRDSTGAKYRHLHYHHQQYLQEEEKARAKEDEAQRLSIISAPHRPSEAFRRPEDHAGNETLGFQEILALSSGPSWRTRGLVAAAELTGLQISIPPQPPLHPDIIEAFAHFGPEDVPYSNPAHGASVAWLAHLDLIKHAIQSNLETVLILEDDVDWDVSIREQMKLVSRGVRDLTHTSAEDTSPYGRAWDVLWIGHCGETWNEQYEAVVFDDPDVAPNADYLGWVPGYAGIVPWLPYPRRGVYRSLYPVCTFAYALSRNGARKVLQLAGGGKGHAFDIKLSSECRMGNLDCISVVPEVVHQYFPDPGFGVKSLVDVGNNGQEEGPQDTSFEAVMGSTENIRSSARCRALWGKDCQKGVSPPSDPKPEVKPESES